MSSVETWTIQQVLERVTSSVDVTLGGGSPAGWLGMLATKLDDDPDRTSCLLAAMEAHGQMDPICITFEGDEWELGNGHHRLTLAILLGWDTIQVDTSDWMSARSDRNEYGWNGGLVPTAEAFIYAMASSLFDDAALARQAQRVAA